MLDAWLPYAFLPPRRPSCHVARPELWRQLRAGLRPDKRLTLLWGPPGLGKSTAAADYASESGLPGLWFNLTPFSLDPAMFLSNLLGGLKTRFPNFDPNWVPLLESTSYKAASPAVTGNLHEALVELAPKGFVLVLDLGESLPTAALKVVLELSVDLLPENAQLIVISDHEEVLAHLPLAATECLEFGPAAVGLQPAERKRLAELDGREACGDDYHDWLDWAWQRWCREQEIAPDAPLPAPWNLVLPLAAHLPWLEPALWQAVAEPIAPWPASTSWPPVLTRLEGETPISLFHPAALARFRLELGEPERQALARRLGVFLTQANPLHAIPAFLQAGDAFQAEALAAPVGEGLLACYHYQALAEVLAMFPEAHRAGSPRLCCLDADLRRVTGQSDEGLRIYQEAEWQARARGDGRWQGRALAGQSAIWGMRGDERFYKLAMEAKEALPAEDQSGRALVYNLLGIYHLQNNELPLAMTYLEEALRLYGLVLDGMGQGKVYVNLGLCQSKAGKFVKAREFYQSAIRCAEDSLKLPIPMVYNNLARVHVLQGELKPAWEAAERALNLSQQLGSRRDIAHAEWTLGEINAQRGDWAKATFYFEASRASAEENGDAIAQANALASQAEINMRQQSWTKAKLLLEQAIALRGLPLSDPAAFSLSEVAARLHLELGEIQQAEELLVPIHKYMERHGFRYFQASVEFALARAAQGRGDLITSSALLQSACKLARENDYHHLELTESRALQERTQVQPLSLEALRPDLQVYSFGHFELRLEVQGTAPLVPSKKMQQLLVYLLLHRKGVSREELSNLFGHQGDSRNSASLMLVSRLRQSLEPTLGKHQPSRFILLQDGRYTFNFGLNYTFDAQEFLYLGQQARDPHVQPDEQLAALKKALDLYRGPLLPTCDDEWCLIERERFRLLANEGYQLLFKAFMDREDFRETVRLAEQAIKQDFLNEEAHRTKLIALARQGKREEALRHFKRTGDHFNKKFGLAPSEELQKIFQQIMRGQLR
jgi:DNA-binding SARP family transcriptional activator